jgi:hypothetical protein
LVSNPNHNNQKYISPSKIVEKQFDSYFILNLYTTKDGIGTIRLEFGSLDGKNVKIGFVVRLELLYNKMGLVTHMGK